MQMWGGEMQNGASLWERGPLTVEALDVDDDTLISWCVHAREALDENSTATLWVLHGFGLHRVIEQRLCHHFG
jgi:hypothetical protein